jgi:hypothetical protein
VRGWVVRAQIFGGTELADAEHLWTGARVPDSEAHRRSYAGAAIFVTHDWKYVGYGTGAVFTYTSEDWCALARTPGTCSTGKLMSQGVVAFPFIQRLRFGPLTNWFVEYEHGAHEPTPLPAPVLMLGLGKVLGAGKHLVRVGATTRGMYVGGVYRSPGWEVEPFAGLDSRTLDTHPRNAEVSLVVRRRMRR